MVTFVLLTNKRPHMEFEKLTPYEEDIGKQIVNAAYKVHSELGPGLLEKIYEVCLVHEIRKAGYSATRHLKLTKLRLGYLINFNVTQIKYGIKRIVL